MDAKTLRRLQQDPAEFRRCLRIDADAGPVRLGSVLEDWQEQDFRALDPAWMRLAGHSTAPAQQRAWLERPRGHSKTSDQAVMIAWVLFASRRKLNGVAAAADKDQARLIRDGVDKLVRLNPFLAKFLNVQTYKICNPHTGSELEILSADVAGSYGLTPDFIVIDEAAHWPKRDLFDSLISSAIKRANCVVVVITNAGFQQHWIWPIRETIRRDPDWHFHRLPGPVASWITADRLAALRRILPEIAYRRLIKNEWTTGAGDAINEHEIKAALTLTGPSGATPQGYVAVAGLDLSTSRHATGLVVTGVNVGWSEHKTKRQRVSPKMRCLIDAGVFDAPPGDDEHIHHAGDGRVRLLNMKSWKPEPGRKVSLEDVEEAVITATSQYNLQAICVDYWQAELMVQRLQRRGIPIHAVHFTGATLQAMATTMLDSFRDQLIDLYPDDDLMADLSSLQVVEKQYGFRLQSAERGVGETGTKHGDIAQALSLALFAARRFNIGPSQRVNRPLVVYPSSNFNLRSGTGVASSAQACPGFRSFPINERSSNNEDCKYAQAVA